MFLLNADKHTDIVFLHQKFKKNFSLLYKSNKRKFTKWFDKPIPGPSEDDFLDLINHSLTEYAHHRAIQCAVMFKKEIIGFIGLTKINKNLNKAELTYWLDDQYTGRGITIAMCNTMIKYAFCFLKLNKLEIAIDTTNIEYRKTCETLNFDLEGILKHAESINGQIIHHAQYGLFNSRSF